MSDWIYASIMIGNFLVIVLLSEKLRQKAKALREEIVGLSHLALKQSEIIAATIEEFEQFKATIAEELALPKISQTPSLNHGSLFPSRKIRRAKK